MHTLVQSFHAASGMLAHLHVDLVGPLPASREGYTHLFTVVDRTTRWPEAVLMKNTPAEDCAKALDSTFQRSQHHHIRQGSPVYISDLAGAVQNIENQACGHNSVPPAEQRSGGALPQTVEKCAQSAHMRHGLGRSPAVGDAEDKGSPKRGFIHLSSKDGLWFTPHSPRAGAD